MVISGLPHSYCAAPGDREVLIGLVGSGSVIGHATRYSGGPWLVTAVCIEPSTLLELSEETLDRIGAEAPHIWQAMPVNDQKIRTERRFGECHLASAHDQWVGQNALCTGDDDTGCN